MGPAEKAVKKQGREEKGGSGEKTLSSRGLAKKSAAALLIFMLVLVPLIFMLNTGGNEPESLQTANKDKPAVAPRSNPNEISKPEQASQPSGPGENLKAVQSSDGRTTDKSKIKKPAVHRVKLRSEPVTVKSWEEARRVFSLNGENRPLNYIDNQFEDHGDGTVSDHATGLMWQQSGSDYWIDYPDARRYVEQLNRSRFAGRADWRLPTLDELCSLLTPQKQGKRYIDPVFDDKQWWCWSADQRSSGSAWLVYFHFGYVRWLDHVHSDYVRAVRTRQ